MAEFRDLLIRAKAGSIDDFERLLIMYKDILRKQSFINGKFDEDLHQELLLSLYQAIQTFLIDQE